jgi:2-polyprenyl-3-methyl-5-hydroxy-6-metoxy-1,4-benzoquinol methylase
VVAPDRNGSDVREERLDACPSCDGTGIVSIDADRYLCRCAECGLVFDNPRPTIEALAAYYSAGDKYNRWLARPAARDRLWQRRLRAVLRARRGGSLLDVGAGTGHFLHFAREYFSPVKGTELSASACAIAKERYGIILAEGDVERIDFGDERFDVITLFHVLEHVPYPGRFLTRLNDLCTPGGVLVVAVPNELFSLKTRLKAVVKQALKWLGLKRFQVYGKFGFSKIIFGSLHDEVHLSHFSERTVRRALEKQGFSIERTALDPYSAARWPASWFERIYYLFMNAIYSITQRNWYDTLWIEARKKLEPGGPVACCPSCGNRQVSAERTYTSPGYRFFKCRRCECVFADPMKSAGKIWYESSDMYRFDSRRVRGDLRWYEKEFLHDRPRSGKGRLLNVGCGMNRFLRMVTDEGYSVTAVDFNEQAIAFTRDQLGIEEAYATDILSFSECYQGDAFDLITVFEVLEHLEDPASLIVSLRRILAPGGVLCLSVPNRVRLLPAKDRWDYPPHHLTRWDRRSIVRFLEYNGFSVQHCTVSRVSPDEMVEKTGLLFFVPLLERLYGRTAAGIRKSILSGTLWTALKGRTLFHTVLAWVMIGLGWSGKNMYLRAEKISAGAKAGLSPEQRQGGDTA